MDNQGGELVKLRVIKVYNVYEIHFCGFIITATFNPTEIISITDGVVKGKNGWPIITPRGKFRVSTHNNTLIFEEVPIFKDYKEKYYSTLTLKDEIFHLEAYDRFTKTTSEYDVEVEYKNFNTKSARNHSV